MKRAGYVLLFGLTSVGASLVAGTGCSSSSSGTGGSTSSSSHSTSTTTSSSSSSTTTSSSSSTSTSSSSSGAATLDCTSYCAEVLANCTGTHQQYGATATDNGMANCMGFCGTFSNKGALGDVSGDTLGCHIYHGGAAKSDPATHCPHAGPTGGDKSVDGGAGTCGEPCDAFCDGALALCPAIYATKDACKLACAGFSPDPAAYLSTDATLQGANTIGCRVYHLTAAAGGTAAATTHCPHIAAVSAVCKN